MEVTSEIIVTEQDIDVFQHMNYKRYIDYFEKSRADWFIELGLSYAKMAELGFAVVILKLETMYKKESRLGDRLTVTTSPHEMGTKSFTLKQVIYNDQQEPITETFCTFVMFDLTLRTSRLVVEEIARQFPVKAKA